MSDTIYKIQHLKLVKETRNGYDLLNYWYRAEGDKLPRFNLFEADFHALIRAGYVLERKADNLNCDIFVTLKQVGKFWQINQLHLPDDTVADFAQLVESAKRDLIRANRAAIADYNYYRSHRY